MNVISPEELARGPLEASETLSGLILLDKPWGKTPLQALDLLRNKFPRLAGVPLSYAGRLDPLADGLLVVLVGETNKDRETYLGLTKVYEFEVLVGLGTDTGDIFGVVQNDALDDSVYDSGSVQEKITTLVSQYAGQHIFEYPVYSSKTVEGKPLFQYAQEGLISDGFIHITKCDENNQEVKERIKIPSKEVTIFDMNVIGTKKVSTVDVLEKIQRAISIVSGNFRYDEIQKTAESKVSNDRTGSGASFLVVKIQVKCSSGTYMRAIAEDIGRDIGIPCIAYSIRRIKVGDFDITSKDVVSL